MKLKKSCLYSQKDLTAAEEGVNRVNDKQIIDMLFERSECALGEIEKAYGKLCLHISMNILSNHTDAEECVNDSYLKIWNTIPPLRPTSFKAYLLKVVKNISINRAKYNLAEKRSHDSIIPMESLESVLSENTDSPFNQSEKRRLENEIECFLDSLDTPSRILFVRRYWYGDSLSYLSDITGYSENNISQKLFTLRNKLKKQLLKGGFNI